MKRPALYILGILAIAVLSLVTDRVFRESDPPTILSDMRTQLREAEELLTHASPDSLARAADIYREVLKDNPEVAEALFGLARADLAAGRKWAGYWSLQRLLRVQENHAQALHLLGVGAAIEGRPREAIRYLEPLRETGPLDREQGVALAEALVETGRDADAETVYGDLLAEHPDDLELLRARGEIRSRLGRTRGAAEDLEPVVRADRNDLPIRLEFASLLLDLGRDDAAVPIVDDLAERRRGELSTPADSAALSVLQARLLEGGGAARASANQLENAVSIDPWNVPALELLAEARYELGNLEGAKEAGERFRQAKGARRGPGPTRKAAQQAVGAARFRSRPPGPR